MANSTTTLLYWHLGRRLLAENLQDERAQYGKRILATVSRELTVEFGQAFTLRSLYRAIQFSQGFTDQEIVSTLSTQLSWSHFIELLPIKDPLARDFYAEMCRIERWDGGVAATIGALRKARGKNKNPTKEQVAIRIDPEVLAAFRADGPGWQTRMNTALKEWLSEHRRAPRRRRASQAGG